MTMRILMLSWEYPPHITGGMGRHVAELSPALTQQSAKIHIVTPVAQPSDSLVTVEEGVTVHRIYCPALNIPADIYTQAREVNRSLEDYLQQQAGTYGPFDLIHTHDWLTGFVALSLQQAWACPLVVTIHATERGRNQGYLNNSLQQSIDSAEHKLAHRAQRVIVCSQYMAWEVRSFFDIPADKVDVIPNGVNTDHLRNGWNGADKTAFRARHIGPEEKLVFTVSRLVYEKGVHLLVQAAPQVLQACPRTRFIIAGRGPEADRLKQQAAALGLNKQIQFIGYISDEERNHFFETADCAIFPSLYEPFGIVALEAMALGCPVIVSDVGGLGEVVRHEETGIKIYPNNVESTTWGIVHTLTHHETVKQYAIHARQAVQQQFNWARIAAMTIEVYHRMLTASP